MSLLRAWIQAVRPLAVFNIWPPLLYGHALAYHEWRRFELNQLLGSLAFGLLIQCFILFSNDYADAAADAKNPSSTFISGGSRVIPEGKLTRRSVGIAALCSGLSLVGISALASWTTGQLSWLFGGLSCLLLVWLYSFPPVQLAYRGHGEWLQALGVGWVLPFIGAAAGGAAPSALLSVPSLVFGGGLAYASHLMTSLPDLRADFLSGKLSPAARLGRYQVELRCSLALCVACTALLFFGSPDHRPSALSAFGLIGLVGIGLASLNLKLNAGRSKLRFVLGSGFLVSSIWFAASLALVYR